MFLDVNHTWTFLQEYTSQIGNGDMYLLVSPFNFFYTSSNAEVNSQIATRRTEFEKPIQDYVVVNHFGRNVLSSEGADWRRQRKMVAPAFSERSNAFVWEQSLQQAQSMLTYWSRLEGNTVDEINIGNTQRDTANLALHVICGAGFGVPQLWPHEDESILGSRRVPGFNTTKLTGNHKMNFKESLRKTTGLEIVWLTVLPRWLISKSDSPFS
jgi:cytochrome P450